LITQDLVSWQFRAYPAAHRAKGNLLVHILTAPLFVTGALCLPTAFALHAPLAALGGAAAMLLAVIAQGRGHKTEENPPAPFASPVDVVVRIFVEQFVTFPRFVLSGGFGRAWRAAR
jgi:hypothetical protein